MTGEIALSCRFTSFGNAFLAGKPFDRDALNDEPRAVASLTFEVVAGVAGTQTTRVVAREPRAGFEGLRRAGTRRLALVHGPEDADPKLRPVLAAFSGGGGTWLIAAHEAQRTMLWVSRWGLADVPRGSRTPWDVVYVGGSVPLMPAPPPVDLTRTAAALDRALTDAAAFAADEPRLKNWIDWFERARRALSSAAPESLPWPPQVPLLAPAMHPLAARRLVAAAECAWVFGGMGSWNDYSPPAGKESYRAITAALYASVIDAVVAGVNALA